MKPWFNVRKAAQVAAFFAKQEGGNINVLKLVKLIYLANRKAMEKLDFPLLNDNLVSMDHGPVVSLTYDYINGSQLDRDGWEEFVTDRSGYAVGLVKADLSIDDLDELSEIEIEILTETWKSFGHFDKWKMRDYTHDNCPEWEDPDGSSQPIPYARVFKFLSKQETDFLVRRILDQRRTDELFAGRR
jgi:uncharacterized phage-associated protein